MGVYYSQIKRVGDIAILSLRYFKKGPVVGFDVIRIRMYPPFRDLPENGHTVPEKIEAIECLPSSEKWGHNSWSFVSLEKAEQKFQVLTSNGK